MPAKRRSPPPRAAQKEQDERAELIAALKELINERVIKDILQLWAGVVRHLHRPNAYIRELIARPRKALSRVVITYFTAVGALWLLDSYIIFPLLEWINYPLKESVYFKGVRDSDTAQVLYAAILFLFEAAVIYLLPKVFLPVSRNTLLAVNLQIETFKVFYLILVNQVLKMLVWVVFGPSDGAIMLVIFWAAYLVPRIWKFYIWRRYLGLEWATVVMLFVLTEVVGAFVIAAILQGLGWLQPGIWPA